MMFYLLLGATLHIYIDEPCVIIYVAQMSLLSHVRRDMYQTAYIFPRILPGEFSYSIFSKID